MDYEKLLDEWAEEVYKMMDNAQEKQKNEEFGTVTYYTRHGLIDGLARSLSILNRVENKYKRQIKKETQNG